MTASNDATLDSLKKFLVTGNSSAEYHGVHMIRDVVNWYQGMERSVHKGREEANLTKPIESLLESSVIVKLVEEGKTEAIIDTLRAYNQLSCVDKEALVLCLAVASKQSDQKKLVTDAHSAVREVCTNTHLFFLFIHFSKMIAKRSGHSGWGRGLRRAVSEWYLSWDPQRLALEVTRHTSAHGWTHRDVIRLAHLKLKDMPLGTQVVLHYVLLGLEKTKGKYTGQDNTAALLELLQSLDRHPHTPNTPQAEEQTWSQEQVIAKIDEVNNKFSGITLHDVPSQSLKSQEVWSHLLDTLAVESVLASVNRLARGNFLNPSKETNHGLQNKLVDCLSWENRTTEGVTPAQVLMALHAYQHPTRFIAISIKGIDKGTDKDGSTVTRVPAKMSTRKAAKTNPKIVEALHACLAITAKNIEKTTRRLGIFVDVRGSMGSCHVWTGNPVGKGEVTGHEAAATTVLTLTSGGTSSAVSTLAFSGTTFSELKLTEGMTILQLIEKFKETVIGEVSVERALSWAKEQKAETVVVLTHRLEQAAVTAATTALQRHNEENSTQTRLVLCGLCSKHMSVPHMANMLLVLGFQQRTPVVIRAFHERHF